VARSCRIAGHWRDTQIRITGPAVTPLQTGFAQNWLKTTGELLSGATYYPDHDRDGAPPTRGFHQDRISRCRPS
jgi:phosphatidylserine/phosphatidylglycerophosphate/cardiolipin synthase-like enzyme